MNIPRITDYSGQGVIPQLVKTVNALCDEVQANQLVGDNRTTFINRSRYGTTIRAAAQAVIGSGGTSAVNPLLHTEHYVYIGQDGLLHINPGRVDLPGTSILFPGGYWTKEQMQELAGSSAYNIYLRVTYDPTQSIPYYAWSGDYLADPVDYRRYI